MDESWEALNGTTFQILSVTFVAVVGRWHANISSAKYIPSAWQNLEMITINF
jgi:hypothetical protein